MNEETIDGILVQLLEQTEFQSQAKSLLAKTKTEKETILTTFFDNFLIALSQITKPEFLKELQNCLENKQYEDFMDMIMGMAIMDQDYRENLIVAMQASMQETL